MEETKVSLKLLIDTKTNRVLFAEAGKDFVDFLFHIMSLSVATILKLTGLKGMVGSLGEIYKSIECFSSDYLQENVDKDMVLNPKPAVNVPLLSLNEAPTEDKIYKCSSSSYHCPNITKDPSRYCPLHTCRMSKEVAFLPQQNSEAVTTSSNTTGGYVKGVLTYMVMDNLEVKPLSAICAITLLSKFYVEDGSSLVEREVKVGLDEGVAILKASLASQSVLSTVFLGYKM